MGDDSRDKEREDDQPANNKGEKYAYCDTGDEPGKTALCFRDVRYLSVDSIRSHNEALQFSLSASCMMMMLEAVLLAASTTYNGSCPAS